MNREQVIELARQVRDGGHWNQLDLINFAALVAAAERAHNYSLIGTLIFAEREACARLCEVRADEEIGMAYQGIALDCAAAIRARGQP